MPFTTQNVLGRFRSRTAPTATKSATKASSLFDSGQVGSVPDSPQFKGGAEAGHSDVPAEVPSTGTIPGSYDGVPGELPHDPTPEASGTDVHDQNGPDDAVPTFDIAPGQAFPGNVEGTQSTKAVDPDLQQNALDAIAECIVAEASEDDVAFARIDALSDAAQTLSAPEDDGALPAYMSGDLL